MTDQGSSKASNELKQAAMKRPHLREHLQKFKQITGEFPLFVDEIDGEHEVRHPNVLYPVGGPLFCHVYGDFGQDTKYYTIEPTLSTAEEQTLDTIKGKLLNKSGHRPTPDGESGYDDLIEELLEEVTVITEEGSSRRFSKIRNFGRIEVSARTYNDIRYRLNRDIVGFGPLEPVMRDPENEDIHVIGPSECHVDHGVFGMLETTVDFGTLQQFDSWLRNMGERMGDPVSDSNPIIDSTLPDGSRINIIYSDDVSIKGPSLTIRQGDDTPLSVNQITNWGTLSPELAAYLWLCLENEQTVFVVGETASGKTTTLNAILSFIPRDSKIYTAEDTAEVIPPHNTWQQLLTREGDGADSNSVDMFDLVAAALRSRPDYIIVGEVRGAEGRMAFQAAQTGHPVMLTFHASDIVSMIQRFTSEPINVPETFMDNADVALFQNRVKQGDKVLRRVTSVQEIEGYSKEMDGVVTRQVFDWDPVEDEIVFRGMNNSYVLEEQIATLLGYADTRDIYDDLEFRAELIERMIQEGVLGYHEVNDAINAFHRDGAEGLPFDMHRSGR
ncbi:type II/IV secretion system ATPase subunit [Candidatus Halobonum tyrrellensis]|uniref:Type II secretion system protein E n=1 Tax=Candidatus Halobonum tyrrellensis G22 TaxID=1324957 RepID=V4J285_9EURY|nr:type II/IV secretion system ATPase subunit [Candidatus Halobonum tyrrellensis]ESP89527.1 type II secretion system protein E [Candidatus Halobonum tyrrellensis G22]